MPQITFWRRTGVVDAFGHASARHLEKPDRYLIARAVPPKLVPSENMLQHRRYASIQTAMNVYGQAMPESRREANGKVVQVVLKPMKASA